MQPAFSKRAQLRIPRNEFYDRAVVAAHKRASEVFLRKQFQIGLPPRTNPIMLRINWRLPGGRQPPIPREMPS